MYLGYARAKNFVSAVNPAIDSFTEYTPARIPENGEWNLEGEWRISREYVVPADTGTLRIGFDAKDVFLVIDPEDNRGRVEVILDGSPVADTTDVANGLLVPEKSRLYHLVQLEKPGEHLLELNIEGSLKFYAFTFG
jgi:hypothetical protein